MADVPGDTSPRQGFPGFHWTGLAFIMKLDPVNFDGEGVVALHTDSGLLLQLLMLCVASRTFHTLLSPNITSFQVVKAVSSIVAPLVFLSPLFLPRLHL